MIVGTGVDIVETERIEEALGRHGFRFVKRLFTPAEMEYCEGFKKKAERYAARFAAKEAAFKALGTGWRGVRWLDATKVGFMMMASFHSITISLPPTACGPLPK